MIMLHWYLIRNLISLTQYRKCLVFDKINLKVIGFNMGSKHSLKAWSQPLGWKVWKKYYLGITKQFWKQSLKEMFSRDDFFDLNIFQSWKKWKLPFLLFLFENNLLTACHLQNNPFETRHWKLSIRSIHKVWKPVMDISRRLMEKLIKFNNNIALSLGKRGNKWVLWQKSNIKLFNFLAFQW